MNSSFLMFVVVAVAIIAYVLIAYRSGDIDPFGTFDPSKKVAHQFERYQLPKQYLYYAYRESPTKIYALAGLDPRYTINGDAWQGFDPEEEIVEQLLAQIISYRTEAADGYILVGPDKAPIGVFYSPLPDPAVQVNAQQEVVFALDLPPAWTEGEE